MNQRRERPLPHFVGQDSSGVLLRIAGVDDQRQAGFARHCDMGAKKGLLGRAFGVLIVVIETGLADSDDFRMHGRRNQRRLAKIGVGIRLMRMNADTGPDVRLARCRGNHLIPFALPGRNIEKTADSRSTGTGEDALLVFDQAFVL